MTRIIKVLPLVFMLITILYAYLRFQKNNNIAKETCIIEGMTMYLIIGIIVSIILKKDIKLIASLSTMIGIILGSLIKKH
jgi:prepilin signal peptidase PulO-like enzyme (type II secretory pathway)